MNIKEIIALALIVAGIWLNLMLQDTMAQDASTGWEAQRQHYRLSDVLMVAQSDQVARQAGKATKATAEPAGQQAEQVEASASAQLRQPAAALDAHDESGCD